MSEENRKQKRVVWRRHVVMPAEHGSWAWLLVPFGVGTAVAGQFTLASLLTLLGGLAVFMMRQPATVWFRARRGRARRADGRLAAGWLVGWGAVGLVCLIGLLLLERLALAWLLLPTLIIMGLYLLAARYGRSGLRSLGMEIAGAAALALMAPAAVVAATGSLGVWVWGLWGVMAGQNMLGAWYVRLRIHDTHQRPMNRTAVWLAHALGLLLIVLAGLGGIVPLAVALPFAAFLARAVWAVQQPRPVANVKRFGFLELGVEIASGLWLVACYAFWSPV
ncbi:MAG: YwiC-like family protein [Ardenticatenaceae bacterium]|nr:YwiC-like family protein [Ardenticatenaceae bacterium]